MRCGIAEGVDESFCRGAVEALQALGENPDDFLTCYLGRGRTPAHSYGQQLFSAYARREEGVPELITESDIAVLLGGSKNTQYIGVMALLENKVVFPVAATGGAAADLHLIILGRYERTFRNRLDINKFRALANVNTKPIALVQRVIELIDLCS
jgi:hypothetical protein